MSFDDSQPRDSTGKWTSGGTADSTGAISPTFNPNAAMEEQRAGLNDDESVALQNWVDGASTFSQMRALDAGKTDEVPPAFMENIKSQLDNLHSVMEKAPKYAGVVYRGVEDKNGASTGNLKVGSEMEFNAVSSATTEVDTAKNFIPEDGGAIFEMKTSGLPDIGHWNHEEHEILVPKGTKFRVSKIETRYPSTAKWVSLEQVSK